MNNFKYLQPASLKEASDMLSRESSTAVAFSGGSDLLGMMKNSIIAPGALVNLKNIPDLNKIHYTKGKGLKIGALVTIAELTEHPVIAEKYTALKQAAKDVASPQLRTIGTVGGNICQRPRCWYFREDFNCLRKGGGMCYAFDGQNKYHCVIGGGPCYIVHPSDLAVALTALDASVTIFSKKNTRSVPIKDFFVLPETDYKHENILKPGEIVTEVTIPEMSENTFSRYIKFRERGVWDFAVVSAAAVVRKTKNTIEAGKVAYGGIAPVPWQENSLNSKLKGFELNAESIESLTGLVLTKAEPLEMNQFKILLARNLTKKIFSEFL
ncbi:MAG: FAD binding domain-containing protein [Bacillota bacterium]